jgi:hypothetical protein
MSHLGEKMDEKVKGLPPFTQYTAKDVLQYIELKSDWRTQKCD